MAMVTMMLSIYCLVLAVPSQSFWASAFSTGGVAITKRVCSGLHNNKFSARCAVRLWSDVPVGGCDDSDHKYSSSPQQKSHIVSVKSHNIAGIVNDEGNCDIEIEFGSTACLVCVTGESGSGKSLLVSKALDVVTGGKATNALVQNSEKESWIELTVRLCEPHLSTVSSRLQHFGIDPLILYHQHTEDTTHDVGDDNGHAVGYLHLQRILVASSSGSGKLKSTCRINEKQVSLKNLREIASPLFTIVDVGVASGALNRAASRLAMLDIGIDDSIKQQCIQSRDLYKEATKRRKRIKKELESRILPSSMQGNAYGSELEQEQIELLEHWVDELDLFEARVNRFQEALYEQYSELIAHGNRSDGNNIISTLQQLRECVWGDRIDDDDSIFAHLLQFREDIKAVESQLIAANAAYEGLASLTVPESAAVSLEKVRKLLYTISADDTGPMFEKVERTHELLNIVEESLNDCARSIDGGADSIISTLENAVCTGVSMEEVDGLVADWNALARKHGISPYALPTCHTSLRHEIDGNVEALKLLPEAEEDERVALEDYTQSCKALSSAREIVASNLSRSVTELLPSLGLECTLHVQLTQRPGGFDDPYCGPETLGVDVVDLLLFHNEANGGANESKRGGNIEHVGSSGEKSRVLLAIETCLPGSIGATCNNCSAEYTQNGNNPNPISIVYDEIDAHVGGRAAVTIAKLLADQSSGEASQAGNQIIAITHSASVAAIADRHIVIERGSTSGSTSPAVRASVVNGSSRRKEIARMASGDLAVGEAEMFADALIRDALLHRDA
eukprot:scaffold2849_cov150-Skeletonema_menzelii.AAC.9